MTTFRKKLREYAATEIDQPGEHKRSAIADAFIDAYPDLARVYMRDLAVRQISELIKELCDEPEADPLPLFSGFPAAITVSAGVVKATKHCTFDDLAAGLEYRRENVRHAQEKLKSYAESMAKFDLLRTAEAETVGECADRLRDQGSAAA